MLVRVNNFSPDKVVVVILTGANLIGTSRPPLTSRHLPKHHIEFLCVVLSLKANKITQLVPLYH